jgi:phage antirepressor YoqD-like protein
MAKYKGRGLFTVKTGEDHGHAWTQTKITPKGIVWLEALYGASTTEKAY